MPKTTNDKSRGKPVGHLVVHHFQLAGRERRAHLGAHRLPLSAAHVEQVVGQRVARGVGVQPVVGEVRKVADDHAVDQLGVAHQKERRAHLEEPAEPAAAELAVQGADHLDPVHGPGGQMQHVAEQRHGTRIRHVSVSPMSVGGRAEAVEERDRGDGRDCCGPRPPATARQVGSGKHAGDRATERLLGRKKKKTIVFAYRTALAIAI